MNNVKKGIASVVIASCAFGISPILVKNTINSGMSPLSSTVFRFAFAVPIISLIIILKGWSFRVTKKQLFQLFLFGVGGLGATVITLSIALSKVSTSVAMMCHFTYPLFVLLIMTVVFREKLLIPQCIAIIMILSGVVMLNYGGKIEASGIVFAIASAVAYAFFVIGNKKSQLQKLEPLVNMFYITAFCSIAFGIYALLTKQQLQVPSTAYLCFNITGISIGCMVVGQGLLTIGIRNLGATNAAMLNILEPVVSVFAGIIFLKDSLSFLTALGCFFIIAATLLISISSQIKAKN